MTIFYAAVTIFCAGWSIFFLRGALTGRTVANRGVVMSPRTLILAAAVSAWIGVVSASRVFPELGELVTLSRGGVVFALLVIAFIVSLAVDARRG